MHLISENIQISTSSRFRNSSGYVFLFLDWIFFLYYCSNPFRVHFRPSFLFDPNFHFSLVVFCSHAAFWPWFSVFYFYFLIFFYRNGFLISLIFRFKSSFLFNQRKFFELYVLLWFFCFVDWRSFSFYICSHSKAESQIFWTLLALFNGFCAGDVISLSLSLSLSLSSRNFCVIRCWSYVTYLSKMTFAH